jgi:hypothetical protein
LPPAANRRNSFDLIDSDFQGKTLADGGQFYDHAALTAEFRDHAFHPIKYSTADTHPRAHVQPGMRQEGIPARESLANAVHFCAAYLAADGVPEQMKHAGRRDH